MLVTKTTLDAKAISEEVTSRFDKWVSLYFSEVSDKDELSNLVLSITADVINDINSGELIWTYVMS